jgi:N-acetylneuraminic acid mutarotase
MLRVTVPRILVPLIALWAGASAVAQKSTDSPIVKVADHPMQHARLGAAAVLAGDYIYIFGGSGGGAAIYKAERFDLRTGKTEELRGDFIARRFHSAAEHDGKFYIFGGEGYALPGRAHERKIEVYDPATGTVTISGEMPRPRAKAATVRLGNEVWLIGGDKAKDGRSMAQTNEVEILDLTTMQWRQGPAMPTPRATSAAVVGTFIVVPGGYASRTTHDEVEMYVPQEQGWKRLPALAETISAHSTAQLGRWLFLFGDFENTDRVLAYELPTRKTTRIKPDYVDARGTAAIATADRIYVIGGSGKDSGMLGSSRGVNQAVTRGTERAIIQEFKLNPDFVAK